MSGGRQTMKDEEGYTLIEILITFFLLSIVSTAIYQVMFAGVAGSETARDAVNVSEEARLGFNRMVRDTREAGGVRNPAADGSSYSVQIDFDGDGIIEAEPADASGNYESLTFTFVADPSGLGSIEVSNGVRTETLIEGVDCVRDAGNVCLPVFDFYSSRLEYDSGADGVASPAELDDIPGLGNNNDKLDGGELLFIDNVVFSLKVTEGDNEKVFYGEAQLRNQR